MQSIDVVLEPLRALLAQVGAFVPRLLVALAIVLAGWLLAKAVRFAFMRALRAVNFHVLTERAGIDGFLKQGGIETDATAICGVLAYWLTILVALLIAFNSLGLDHATDLLRSAVLFVPRLFVSLLIVTLGAYFARFVGNALRGYCASAGIGDAELLGRLAQYAVLLFVVLIALDHLDVGGQLLQTTFLIAFAGVVLALALAFGHGGRDWAAALLERWWPRRPRDR
ncbi:MAG: hypothetical protein U5L03_08050 [Burkholderiaceae bacterium]|nr:hypothetical protein [Burkholderiaceae bacterium]